MARTNLKTKPEPEPVYTHGGAVAAHITPALELRRTVLSHLLWENNFYESGISISTRLTDLCAKVSPQTLSDLAVEARTKFHLRHVPLLLTVELAKHGGPLVSKTIVKVVKRADEIAEFVSLYWKDGKRPLSAQIKKGLAQVFNNFDEYQLAKWNRDVDIKLRDVLFLVHAKPVVTTKGRQVKAISKPGYKRGPVLRHKSHLFTRLVNDTMKTPDTHEAAVGVSKTEKVAAMRRLIAEDKLGGLAFLRELRFLSENGFTTPELKAYAERVSLDRILPYRFIAAAKAVPKLEDVIEQMMFRMCDQVPKLPGKTVLIMDTSGSMSAHLSGNSDMTRHDAGNALAVLLRELCEEVVVYATAGNDCSRVCATMLIPPRRGFALAGAIFNAEVQQKIGTGGIFLTQCMDYVYSKEKQAERVIVITDEQDCDSKLNPAKANAFGKENYLINIAAHKNGIGYGKWTHVDGFSDAVIGFIRQYENCNFNSQ